MNTWLRIYLQLASFQKESQNSEFLVPVFSGKEFVQVSKVCIETVIWGSCIVCHAIELNSEIIFF